MSLRTLVWTVVVGVVALTGETRTGGALLATSGATAPSPVLNLRLTVSNELPSLSRQALVAETASIWRDSPVQLRWLAATPSPDSAATLRILVTPRAVVAVPDGHDWAVGELIRFQGSSAIAVASISGAQRVVNETQHVGLIELPAVYEHRLGVVLGRAVAHEIGHYVLQTNTHATSGLMRATIDAREFADLRSATFRLDRAAHAHLAARAARGVFSLDGRDDAFSYPEQ